MRKLLFAFGCLLSLASIAQKKPLDHTVYDAWQSIGDRMDAVNRWLIGGGSAPPFVDMGSAH